MAAEARSVNPTQREHLLWGLSVVTFLIFFQAFMIAPLLPRLAELFDVSVRKMGLVVPAYLIPYGVATLAYGPLSDRFGRAPIIFGSLLAFIALTAGTALASSLTTMVAFRTATGIGASGVVPTSLALVGGLYPFHQRGRPLGWLFGAMAGGMAFGSTAGAMLEPIIGWQALFVVTAALAGVSWLLLLPYRSIMTGPTRSVLDYRGVITGYGRLLASARGKRTYAYVLVNSVFQSGVFTWLGLYFTRRYDLSETEIGLALLGYGLPGLLLGPIIGHTADRLGRGRLIPLGLALGGAAALASRSTCLCSLRLSSSPRSLLGTT